MGHLIAEPYHQEAFFRNFGRQSSDLMTLELTKSFSGNNQEFPITIRRNQSSRFKQRDYFDVMKFSSIIFHLFCLYDFIPL